MSILVLLGRILFSAIFIMASIGHFTKHTIDSAATAGVPMATILVPLSGIIALLGGLSILLGYRAKLGALLLIVFLIPVTIMMHKFWAVTDPQTYEMQFGMFLKNVSILGGALIITYFGSGPWSLDRRV